jgi:hypothetical protein
MSWVDMMSKENYISSDKLFEMFSSAERDVVDQIRRFGTIHIHGNMVLISSVVYPKVVSWLYFNNSQKKFYLVKKFDSGKYHCDFFVNVDRDPIDFYEGQGLEYIAVAEFNDVQKHLYYDFEEKAFVVMSSSGHSLKFTID